jgi:hypothetical protein
MMGRPFIEFVQSQALPWREGRYGQGGSGLRSKTLSLDPDTGASSLLIEYPAGWSSGADGAPRHLGVDEEFFVLAGELILDDVRYSSKGYAHLPAGFTSRHRSSPGGAVVLNFYSGEPTVLDGAAECDERRLVTHVDGLAGEWGGNFHPKFPPGAGRKFLRRDPVDGEETWLLGTMPLRSGRRAEKHPVVEEMYLLSGELVGPLGVMQAGCYFWRPPEEWHGPFGSLTGNLMLFRTKGGPLSTVYTEHETDFSWKPAHAPILPTELEPYGREPQAGCQCY